jgi:hypothetical protein
LFRCCGSQTALQKSFRAKDLLNKTISKVSMSGVNWLKQTLVLLLLATWLPAANHCFLETAGLVSDECDTTQNTATPSSDPCDTGCKLAEQTGFKVTQQKFHAQIPLVITFVEIPEHLPKVSVRPLIHNWPTENFRLPQFVLATALPIRAPSFVS